MPQEAVDAVITWVDGYDEAHQEKLADYLASQGLSRPTSAAATRFNQHGEIDFCVNSLLRFAPWIRTIFIVTDAQVPPIITKLRGTIHEGKVKLVDHREIFSGFEDYLPTFNSVTIESMLWRIKGISTKIIYFNDDCSLIRPVKYEDFFRDNSIVLRGIWKTQTEKKWRYSFNKLLASCLKKSAGIKKNEHRTLQENTAKLVGWDKKFFHLPHIPLAFNTKTLENYFFKKPELLSENLRYPLRDLRQFLPISLAHNLEIQQNNVIFDNSLEAITVNGACHSLKKIQSRLGQADKREQTAFICMQSLDQASKTAQNWMLNWLDERVNQNSVKIG